MNKHNRVQKHLKLTEVAVTCLNLCFNNWLNGQLRRISFQSCVSHFCILYNVTVASPE